MWCACIISSSFNSWNGCTIFCCGSLRETFLFKRKKKNLNEQAAQMRWVECLPSRTISVLLSHSSSFKPTLQSEREDLRQAPSTFCLALPFSDTLFGVCVSFFSLSLQNPVPLFRSTYPKFSIKSKWQISKWDLWYFHMLYGNSTGNAVLNSSNSYAHFAY